MRKIGLVCGLLFWAGVATAQECTFKVVNEFGEAQRFYLITGRDTLGRNAVTEVALKKDVLEKYKGKLFAIRFYNATLVDEYYHVPAFLKANVALVNLCDKKKVVLKRKKGTGTGVSN